MAFIFKYGGYNFRPRPLLSISSQPLKTPDGSGFGVQHDITLDGDILLTGSEVAGASASGINLVFNKIEDLKDALNKDGCALVIQCDDATTDYILSGYPTVESYSFNNESDNYALRAGYSINFKMHTLKNGTTHDTFNGNQMPPYIETATESWDVQFSEEEIPFSWQVTDGVTEDFGYSLAVSHSVDVTARRAYSGCPNTGQVVWESAKQYAQELLGFKGQYVDLSGVLGFPGEGYSGLETFNNFRTVSTNKTEGSINITETFLVRPIGTGIPYNNVTDSFESSIDQSEGIVSVSINGTVQGLGKMDWPALYAERFSVGEKKYDNALTYFNSISGINRIYDRAKKTYDDIYNYGISDDLSGCPQGAKRSLNPQARNKSIAVNPILGTINYNYTFDTLPSGLFTVASGGCVISENVSIDDQLLTDVFASQTVIGRGAGPILQDIGTTSARVRTVSIELVCLPPTNYRDYGNLYATVPTGAIESFITGLTGNLPGNPDAVFVSSNSQNWNFTTGRYTKQLGVTYNNCS